MIANNIMMIIYNDDDDDVDDMMSVGVCTHCLSKAYGPRRGGGGAAAPAPFFSTCHIL